MKKVAIIAAALVLGVAGIAVAATNNVEVPKASLTSTVKVHDGKPLGPNSVGHIQLKNSVISCEKLVPSLRSAVCKLSLISNGTKGDKGDAGANGVKGDAGNDGKSGVDGKNGKDGADAASPRYAQAQIWVYRGSGNKPGTPWATYSTPLGSPFGDTTGGTFRFTCSTAQAPCEISVKTATSAGTAHVYPRLLVYKQGDGDGGGDLNEVYCEYADGPTSSVSSTLTQDAVNIGGSADCGSPVTTAGNVQSISVPNGYYDVQSTFAFLP
jgi:hypothetical protein